MKLSVVIATFNEEENLGKCLDAVKDIAEEIIIIDGGSTDATIAIAKKYGAKITQTSNPPIFHINKQKGLDKAKGEWILQLDADEVVSSDLKKEIQKIVLMSDGQIKDREIHNRKDRLFKKHQQAVEKRDGEFFKANKPVSGFFVPRSNMFLGRKMRYAGMYPDGVVRLVRRGFAHFPCLDVHEQIQVDGSVAWLENDLVHYDSPTFEKYLKKANRYTTLTANKIKNEQVPISLTSAIKYLVIKPASTFLNLYFRHKGILDGFPGFVFSLFSGLHHAIAYMKYTSSK